MNQQKIITATIFSILFFFAIMPVANAKYSLIESMPGVGNKGAEATFPAYVTGIYKFSIAIVSIAALLMITLGGFYYITSAGNQAQATTAKKMITDALLGLVVIFCIYLILTVINEDLINASPSMSGVQIANPSPSNKPVVPNVHCGSSSNQVACYNSQQECESAAGAGNCKKSQNAIADTLYYSCSGGVCTEYTDLDACEKDGDGCMSGAEAKQKMLYNINTDSEIKEGLSAKGIDTKDGVEMGGAPPQTIDAVENITKEYAETAQIIKGTETHGYGTDKLTVQGTTANAGENNKIIKGVEKNARKVGTKIETEPDAKGRYTVSQTYVYEEGHEYAGQKVVITKSYTEQFGPDIQTGAEAEVYGKKVKPPEKIVPDYEITAIDIS